MTGQEGENMNFGKKLKELRLQKAVTQEQMAERLGVSPQAVSKWENDINLPDIQLLPEISIYFGVTIDELFDITDEGNFERIENMLYKEAETSIEDFEYAQTFLKKKFEEPEKKAKSLTMMATLYNHMAEGFSKKAEFYAKEALELEPEKKDNHSELNCATHGVIPDWNLANHHEQIDYYKAFVKKNPSYASGYLWLMDALIADGRLEEARDELKKMRSVRNDFRVLLYEGMIEEKDGNKQKAMEIWQDMLKRYPDEWLVHCSIGDCLAYRGEYEAAIPYYEEGEKLQPSPKYTDSAQSRAHIYEIIGDYPHAIKSWERYIEILNQDWNITEGEQVEYPKREISRLKKLLVS